MTFIINVDNKPLEEPFSIEWAKYVKEAKYLSLFQNIAFSTNLLPENAKKEFPEGIPCDYSCPLTKDMLERRVWKRCGLYFGSTKSNQQHSPVCRMNESSAVDKIVSKKVKPCRCPS